MPSIKELEFRENRVKEYLSKCTIEDYQNQKEILQTKKQKLQKELNEINQLEEDLFRDINYYYFIAWNKTIPK